MTHRQNWRIVEDGSGDAAWNMAVDEAIAESCRQRLAPPTLRFYRWTRPALTIGYFQKATRDINDTTCRKKKIPVIRRITGGRAVLHGNDLTYSVASGRGTTELPHTLQGSFLAISRGLIEGLRRLGLDAEIVRVPPRKTSGSPLCLASTSGHEITCSGRKVLGNAQRRWKDGMLQQGSLLLDFNAEDVCELFYFEDEAQREKTAEEARIRIVGLNDLLATRLDTETVSNQIAMGFEKVLGASFKPARLTPLEEERAYQLMKTKYSQESWNRAGKCVFS